MHYKIIVTPRYVWTISETSWQEIELWLQSGLFQVLGICLLSTCCYYMVLAEYLKVIMLHCSMIQTQDSA